MIGTWRWDGDGVKMRWNRRKMEGVVCCFVAEDVKGVKGKF